MGTDIHVNLEVRNKESQTWEDLSLYIKNRQTNEFHRVECYSGRDYELFGLLAGIYRSNVEPLVDTRGLPDDLAPETHERFYCFDEDGEDCSPYWHDVTWYDMAELRAYCDSARIEKYDETELAGFTPLSERFRRFVYSLQEVLDHYWIYYPRPGDARVVLWFDS